jgi:hypothetical protein
MSTAIQRRRGSTAQHNTFTGLNGETTVDTDKKTVVVHDGVMAGGFPLARQDLSNVPNGAIGSSLLANGAVTTAKVADGAVTQVKLASDVARQIQLVSASVAGNALTISASALTLDFRSTTLGSGTVTRVSGTPANLVISSGSTLGTVNAVQSDIAVLALNNAGTLELAAVNLAGGTDLSETNLISTTAEGGAGAADSAAVVYSTTARSTLAYRVIGIIRSTQATAGTWVTAPSLIQGAGGQAITAMSSLGYGQTYNPPSRAAGTTYYNTSVKPRFVSMYLSTTSGVNQGSVSVNGNTIVSWNNTATSLNFPITFIVPPGQTYLYTNTNNSPFSNWFELG